MLRLVCGFRLQMDKSFCFQISIDNKSNIPPQDFNCSYASSVINKNAKSTYNLWNPLTICGIRLHLRIPHKIFADSAYTCGFHFNFCGIHLQLRNPEQLAIFSGCGIRNKTNVPTKCMLNPLKVCLWNPFTFWNIF